jgi:hypothetical protein
LTVTVVELLEEIEPIEDETPSTDASPLITGLISPPPLTVIRELSKPEKGSDVCCMVRD